VDARGYRNRDNESGPRARCGNSEVPNATSDALLDHGLAEPQSLRRRQATTRQFSPRNGRPQGQPGSIETSPFHRHHFLQGDVSTVRGEAQGNYVTATRGELRDRGHCWTCTEEGSSASSGGRAGSKLTRATRTGARVWTR